MRALKLLWDRFLLWSFRSEQGTLTWTVLCASTAANALKRGGPLLDIAGWFLIGLGSVFFKRWLFAGTIVRFTVEGESDDGGDDEGDGQEIAAPLMPATKDEMRAAACDCPACQRQARLGVN